MEEEKVSEDTKVMEETRKIIEEFFERERKLWRNRTSKFEKELIAKYFGPKRQK